ncbi:MAG: PEP-CTERM sorting domain-containing protein [Planctomycetes bacterium]|nr:PEP-CTERM sorting domain-containing protein [Planctomycetota bacterium]
MRHWIIAVSVCALVSAPATADILYFTDHGAFTQHNEAVGKFLKGVEDFEESSAGPQEKIPFPNSLQNGVPRPTFPNGIDATNLIIQTNITPGPCPPTPNPSTNDRALWVNGPGFIGSNSIKIGTDEFLYGLFSSIDLIFTSHDKTAVGVDVSTFTGYNQGHQGFVFCVYDDSDNVLGTYTMSGPTPTEPAKNFFGVWSSTPIGRVNIWGIFDAPQPFAVDNIEMWVPEPNSLVLLAALGAVAAQRRRN